jgi:long-chain acyl-CoA synthetase
MTSESKCVLITGATGFLGTQLTQRILRETQHEILVLVRGTDEVTATQHLKRAWWEFPELIDAIGNQIHLIKGNIAKKELALEKEEYLNLVQSVTHIIHTAADLRLNAPLEELRETNREGTINILKLGREIEENHGLDRFSHVSTAYVAGGRKGIIDEGSLTDEAGFLSNYEESKYESELEVKNSHLRVSVFRPGMIVGDSKTGYIKTFNTLYVPLRLYLSGKQRFIPIKPTEKINLIPIDYVADAVTRLTFDPEAEGLTFHLTAPDDSLPTVEELIKFVRTWAEENLNYRLPRPIFIPKLAMFIGRFSSSKLIRSPQTRRTLEIISALSPYFNEEREFSLKNTEKLVGNFKLNWKDYLPNLLQFAVHMGFFHRSERTMHEQILFRLKSRSRPVNYYDIVDGRSEARPTSHIRQDMIKAARSLGELGIEKGDRVALVGFNSTRYLILDVAIGLVGAVSVPLYYTSSIEEIKEIIKDCKASVLFVGVSGILNKLNSWETGVNLISFIRESYTPTNIMDWDDFLNLTGKSDDDIPLSPVDLNDVATIRYTSGTTGKPRGAVFTHGTLRWMAEYIASMPPWKNRNEEVSYLSFLPMNHVVEGIMGLYGPYYAPAPLNIYFLEDFQDLPQTLPDVRPTIFFSVPRFYEKVWSGLTESLLGEIYLKSSEGLIKKMMRRLIRRSVLKKVGLDRCAQLIVGSAPVSEDLLSSYHELGIEIYNAYGLTEAPLITMNQLGANRIGTVGEPLPQTEINISSDGEVRVKGPQIMTGYFDDDVNSAFKNGWLLTGDFGHLTSEGSLVITGRKKEVLVNSYGKTISPLKIESMLKDIPGVAEAILIGEGKPYCSCLLWLDDLNISIDSINASIKEINSKISRPEEIKKWIALKNDLSIENGELTANLKLKRRNIIIRFEDVINCIYEDVKCPESILHLENMKFSE